MEHEKYCPEFRCPLCVLIPDMRKGGLCQQDLWRKDLYERILLTEHWSSESWDVVLYKQQIAQRYLEIIPPLTPFFGGKMRLWPLQCQGPTSLIQVWWKLSGYNQRCLVQGDLACFLRKSEHGLYNLGTPKTVFILNRRWDEYVHIILYPQGFSTITSKKKGINWVSWKQPSDS